MRRKSERRRLHRRRKENSYGERSRSETVDRSIPKEARDTFELKEGDRLVVLGDEKQGIALIKAEKFEEQLRTSIELSRREMEE